MDIDRRNRTLCVAAGFLATSFILLLGASYTSEKYWEVIATPHIAVLAGLTVTITALSQRVFHSLDLREGGGAAIRTRIVLVVSGLVFSVWPCCRALEALVVAVRTCDSGGRCRIVLSGARDRTSHLPLRSGRARQDSPASGVRAHPDTRGRDLCGAHSASDCGGTTNRAHAADERGGAATRFAWLWSSGFCVDRFSRGTSTPRRSS